MKSLRAKIRASYAVFGFAVVVGALVVIVNLFDLQEKISEGRKVADFFVATEHMRLSEKNLFLYHQAADLDRVLDLLAEAEVVLAQGRVSFEALAVDNEMRELDRHRMGYRELIATYADANLGERSVMQAVIRDHGQFLSNLANEFRVRERTVLAEAARASVVILLVAVGQVILLGVLSALYIGHQVIRPIKDLEAQLDGLAENGQQQLITPSVDSEIESFITHFNQMQSRLHEQQLAVRHHEKAAALGILVSGVAHELNNPLSNISTSAQLLVETQAEPDPEMQSLWLQQIDGETERARGIVRRLLDHVRHPKLNLQYFPVVELLEKSRELVASQLSDDVSVQVDAGADVMVEVDRDRMQQLFINLVKNAANVGAKNIWLRGESASWSTTRPARFEHLYGEIESVRQHDTVTLMRVEDDGPGVAEENLEHLFDPFFTTRPSGEGTGLGLYLVTEIVSEHYGCIAVENRVEGGARFTIWLPDKQEEKA